MPNPDVPILTIFQIEILKALAASRLGNFFFLTGGTALAGGYLFHRLSEDLDLFTQEPGAVQKLVVPTLQDLCARQKWTLETPRTFSTFVGAFITSSRGEKVKMDFAEDSPYRLEPIRDSPWGVRIDNPLDISCNKLSALFERAVAKDFVDVYFIVQKLYPFDELLTQAKRKHVGLDAYWLSVAFQQVEAIQHWPIMKLPCDFDELRRFFLEKARDLLKGL